MLALICCAHQLHCSQLNRHLIISFWGWEILKYCPAQNCILVPSKLVFTKINFFSWNQRTFCRMVFPQTITPQDLRFSAVTMKNNVFLDVTPRSVLACSAYYLALQMSAVSSSEMSITYETARRLILEDISLFIVATAERTSLRRSYSEQRHQVWETSNLER